jgi:hypothetical protein
VIYLKHVVSVSLGSSTRDHKVDIELMGERFIIERIGMNGNYKKFLETVRNLDGKVDAIGMGGISIYLPVKNRTYIIKSALPLMRAALKTPVADGSYLRNALEPYALHYLQQKGIIDFCGKKVMVTCAVDRYALSKAFADLGCKITCADLIFTLGIPFLIRSLQGLNTLAMIIAPAITKLPFDMLYPTGQREEAVENSTRFAKFYKEADIIAGDFNYIKRYMPDDLKGKIIVTNTITKENIEELRVRNVSALITTTPEFDSRSFGTNVIEAIMLAILKKPVHQITNEEYIATAEKLGFKPRIIHFN